MITNNQKSTSYFKRFKKLEWNERTDTTELISIGVGNDTTRTAAINHNEFL